MAIFTTSHINDLIATQGEKGYIYGKARKYYTLYSYVAHDDGKHQVVTYTFEKVIGLHHDNKYPVNENIHGRLVTESYDNEPTFEGCRFVNQIDYTIMKVGKYKGQHFNECQDTDYLVWYTNNALHDDEYLPYRIECNKVILARDNKWFFYTSEEGDIMVDGTNEIWQHIIKGEPFVITSEKNVSNDNGLLYYPGMGGIPFEFDMWKGGRFAASVAKSEHDCSRFYNIKGKSIIVKQYAFEKDMPMFRGFAEVGVKDVVYIKEWDFA